MIDVTITPTGSGMQYWRYKPPAEPFFPSGSEHYGDDYRGFKITRDTEFMLWCVNTKEEGEALVLQGKFTTKTKAMDYINSFWAEEEKNKKESQ